MATPQERHPEFFQPVGSESPRGKKRTVPMECLCLGFSRTGTVSMCNAMETLGLRCWHSMQLMSTRFGEIEMWQEGVDRKFFGAGGQPFGREEFDQLLHDVSAVSTDTPALAFADDLIAAYPEAKVVLVEREMESWYASWMNSVIKNTFNPIAPLAHLLDPFFLYPLGKVHKTTLQGWAGISSVEEARAKSRTKYREHYAMVRRMTPPHRLLEFNLAEDGWEPLCRFLDKPVPDTPFPHLNRLQWLDEKVQLGLKRSAKGLAMRGVLYLGPFFVACLAYYLIAR
ncbi:hypothetical protein ASPZODRAFT_60072 [Penicilliopsis zonata CBS 506.65]|uniref:Efflux pump antibiotic resistance protein n=1 Tax=Penicilliopsis zonata CBS 506.65 TaxID=1073090 RepID=A0A1L9SQ06_9EURO|nr:hypothetical protein ASPZODRAFT_60072 [Penicilliopsis zonata CBS 506.65]OJJ49300.1 hypothetical protein ASPZODRAFT_60072 [Penicilliopsis zonata CBS 506.65]